MLEKRDNIRTKTETRRKHKEKSDGGNEWLSTWTSINAVRRRIDRGAPMQVPAVRDILKDGVGGIG